MAEKLLNTRIQLKYDTLANWSSTSTAGQGANLVLKSGELGICYVPAVATGTSTTAPTVLFKVGDGTTKFSLLPWASGLAADVYDWAKASSKPSYSASEIDGLKTFIESNSDYDTDTKYQLVADGANKFKVQSKGISDSSWSDVSGQSIELVQNSSDGHKIGFKVNGTAPTTWITIPDNNTTYSDATTSSSGLMSAADKAKLDGVAANANNYSLPTASASTLGGVKVGTNLSISNGVLSATDTTYSVATTSAAGLMSATDKSKLDGIASGAEVNVQSDWSQTITTADDYIKNKPTALKNPNALSIGGKSYDGSSAITVSAADLGIANAMHFKGGVSALPSGVSGYAAGDVIVITGTSEPDKGKEYVCDGTNWIELGDETSYVVKETGKGLSTNDYTTAEKNKLAGIEAGANKYSLPAASASTLGGVKVGTNLSISDGVLSAVDTTYSAATTSAAGLMSAADKAKLDGVAANANNYSLPTASASTLGGVKVGTNLSISDGVLSAKDTTYTFDGTYNASTNKAATVSTVTSAINGLDSSISATAADGNKYSVLTSVTEADGKLSSKTEVKLEAIAKTGNVNDLIQTSGDVIVFNCGSSTTII